MAEMMRASTLKIRPTVITAPTMVRSCAIPGRPESFGLMSISIGSSEMSSTGPSMRAEASSNTVCSLRCARHSWRKTKHGRQQGALVPPELRRPVPIYEVATMTANKGFKVGLSKAGTSKGIA